MQIYVGLSGGVDSAVTAHLLKQFGQQITGVFMKNWQDDQKFCSTEQDFADVRAVAEQLDIPYYSFNFEKEYWDHVFQVFLDGFKKGFTPNPDILCNKEVKFKFFLQKCLASGADKIATGHYARVRENADGTFDLLRGVDTNKDQSYFLCLLTQAALSKTIFPLGELSKPQVREIAQELDLAVKDKKDSTGICFIGERHFADFLQQYLPAQPGDIVNEAGEVIGRHEGTMYYTIGQRKGLGIGGPGGPWFVASKDVANNTLTAVAGEDHPALLQQELAVMDWHWINPAQAKAHLKTGQEGYDLTAQVRYRQAAQPVKITELDTNGLPKSFRFQDQQRAITPGQQLVLYADELCLGGGVIVSAA